MYSTGLYRQTNSGMRTVRAKNGNWPAGKKKPRRNSGRGLPFDRRLRLSAAALGSFQRIHFGLGCFGGFADMRSQVAVAVTPFCRWFRTSGAEPTLGILRRSVTAVALFHDLLANPASVGTSFCGHKRTLDPFFDGSAFHWYHPLSNWILWVAVWSMAC